MLLVASQNGSVGMDVGWSVLAAGGSALDAVEAAARVVEDNPDDHTVGFSGYPNLLGQVELDASVMDGHTLRAGAVGALRGYRYATSVARRVLEDLPHVFLVGEGAAQFAASLGMQAENLLTPEAAQVWRDGIAGRLPADHSRSEQKLVADLLRHAPDLPTDPEYAGGTVNFLAQDSHGHIASAVSTSGWAWKYPGRLGDSPVVGAGNYADDRYGAAACTGWGELALQAGTARSVLLYLKMGYDLEAACREAFHDLRAFVPESTRIVMSMVAIDRAGNHRALSTTPQRTYVYRSAGMTHYDELPRLHYAV
jgi:beta-aspartyl-peptidase (threonine type)